MIKSWKTVFWGDVRCAAVYASASKKGNPAFLYYFTILLSYHMKKNHFHSFVNREYHKCFETDKGFHLKTYSQLIGL